MSMGTIVIFASDSVVAFTFLLVVDAIGQAYTFWILAVIGLACWLFTYLWIPETKGRSLEEIESLLRARRFVVSRSREVPPESR